MDITQLQYFKVIAETGSLTKAAKTLHISQPAMSAMLKKFEEELNVELFDRSPNRIFLNQTGEIALVHINHILQNVEQMKTDLLNAAQQNGLAIKNTRIDCGLTQEELAERAGISCRYLIAINNLCIISRIKHRLSSKSPSKDCIIWFRNVDMTGISFCIIYSRD